MDKSKSILSFLGIATGAIALLLALVHFWAGPFSPQPSLEKTVAEKAVAIKNAAIAAMKGESIEEPEAVSPSYDLDRITSITTAVLGGLALILGVIGFALKEPLRVAGGGALLGGGAIAFQFLTLALAIIVVVILVAAVLSEIGIE